MKYKTLIDKVLSHHYIHQMVKDLRVCQQISEAVLFFMRKDTEIDQKIRAQLQDTIDFAKKLHSSLIESTFLMKKLEVLREAYSSIGINSLSLPAAMLPTEELTGAKLHK